MSVHGGFTNWTVCNNHFVDTGGTAGMFATPTVGHPANPVQTNGLFSFGATLTVVRRPMPTVRVAPMWTSFDVGTISGVGTIIQAFNTSGEFSMLQRLISASQISMETVLPARSEPTSKLRTICIWSWYEVR